MTSPETRRQSIAIVGGGLTGIAAALELAQSGRFKITIFEKERRLGGLISSYEWRDQSFDRFYHVILPSDYLMVDLVKRLGLESRLIWRKSKTGFYGEGRLVPFSSAMDFIKFPFLSRGQKFRLGLGIYRSSRIKNPDFLDSLDVPQWLNQRFGQKVYENFWEPLIRSKLGDAAARTSAGLIWATIKRLYGARRGAANAERLGALEGGISVLQGAAEKRLAELGVDVRTETPVEHLSLREKQITLSTRQKTQAFDKVLLTVPGPEIAKMIRDETSAKDWRGILETEYLGVVCVLLILRRPLSPYYVINLLDKSLPFTGIIETTNILSPESFGGRRLVYLPKYVSQDDPLAKTPEARVIDTFIHSLKKIFPDLDKDDILHSRVFRELYVQPIRRPGFWEWPAGFRTPLPGVYLANSSLIKNSTLNNDAVLELAREAVSVIVAESTP